LGNFITAVLFESYLKMWIDKVSFEVAGEFFREFFPCAQHSILTYFICIEYVLVCHPFGDISGTRRIHRIQHP
jgi:hypothetical protein